jgi:Protein of unknown function (DUF2934)
MAETEAARAVLRSVPKVCFLSCGTIARLRRKQQRRWSENGTKAWLDYCMPREKPAGASIMNSKRDEQIRRRAHQIWEREGRRHGEHEKHWHQASREVDDEVSGDGSGLEPTSSNADARLADDKEPTLPDAPLGEAVARAKRARTLKSVSKPATAGKASSAPRK